jgi:hypothetical protein
MLPSQSKVLIVDDEASIRKARCGSPNPRLRPCMLVPATLESKKCETVSTARAFSQDRTEWKSRNRATVYKPG